MNLNHPKGNLLYNNVNRISFIKLICSFPNDKNDNNSNSPSGSKQGTKNYSLRFLFSVF